jgi:hypothetical protein
VLYQRPHKQAKEEAMMGVLRMRIGGDGRVVAESDATGWRLLVHRETHSTGVANEDLHVALRELALRDRALARDAFGVICNCVGAWEDEYTEEHGQDALAFEGWMERIEFGGVNGVDDVAVDGGTADPFAADPLSVELAGAILAGDDERKADPLIEEDTAARGNS